MDPELTGSETSLDDAVEAFMKSTPDEEALAGVEVEDEEEEVSTEAETAEDDGGEDEGDGSEAAEEGEGDEDPAPKVAEDDAEVVVTVDGKEQKFAVKDLKALAAQKTQLETTAAALAAQRRVMETQGLYLAKVLDDRFKAAKEKVEKYKDVDLFRASRELDPEEFDALRAAKESAESELKALEIEGKEFVQRSRDAHQRLLREQAKESMKVIAKAIPDWNDALYDQIRTYAVAQGMDRDTVNTIVDPGAIVMMNKARLYDLAQEKKTEVKEKVAKAPTKVLKKSETVDREASAVQKLRKAAAASGSVDDVAEAFFAATKK
ncbi:hypothetical protein Q9295_10160 [Xinfangfangia sp. CPCC 101601]|uniref:Scaffolding protein n=1 Tax=Pseudogemmobacter lacusdianii TaxID=3069608 RepID=A0ABU0VYB2_9RHOB|nr:hypothetical protein [Xinfangfangia sp. CPCC 101601]MDQ2066741.1 hypothetical protein [Xinfangfangia sp. CPCC 101601]